MSAFYNEKHQEASWCVSEAQFYKKDTTSILLTSTSQFLDHYIVTQQFRLQRWPQLYTVEKLWTISTKGHSEVFQTLGA